MSNIKLSDVKKEIIQKRLETGFKIKEIAREFEVSEKTISRIKKDLAANTTKSEDEMLKDMILRDYRITDTKKYQGMKLEQVRREMEMFEDTEEGWTYTITKDDPARKFSGRWFRFIVYPESAPQGWRERLAQICECAVSPMHDKDWWNHDSPAKIDKETGEITEEKGARYKAGDRKKAHWHGIAVFDRPLNLLRASAIIQNITHGPLAQICGTLKGSYDYFLHINDPEKYQNYSKDEIWRSAGFHVIPNTYEKEHIYQSLIKYIVENEIDSYRDLNAAFMDKPEFLKQMKSGSNISNLLTEFWLKHHPEGRTRNIRIVKDERR